jgi:hypothetical protein
MNIIRPTKADDETASKKIIKKTKYFIENIM